MKFTLIIKFVLILLIPFTIFAETNSKDNKSANNNDKLRTKIDQLNEQSVQYLRLDIPKAVFTANEALALATKINYKKGEADATINLVNSIYSKTSITTIIDRTKSALKIYREIKDKDNIAKTLNQLSLYYYALQNYTESYNNAKEALSIYENLNYKLGMADSYIIIGRIYNSWEMTKNAEEAFNHSKNLYREISFKEGIADVLLEQGNLYSQKGDNKTAKLDFMNAIYLYKVSGNIPKLGESYNIMSQYYSDYEKDIPKAFYYIDKAIEITNYTKDSARLASFLTHRAHLYFLSNELKLNLLYDQKALQIRQMLHYNTAIGSSYINIGSDYILLKDFSNAEKNLLIGFRMSNENNIKYYARRAALLLHGLYRMENKPIKALFYLDSAYKLTQIINKEEKVHQSSLVEAERKLRIGEQEINYLEEIRNSNFKKMLWIIITLGFFTTCLFFYLYRIKKSDNQKLKIKANELKLSENRYRNLIDTATDFIYTIDSNGCFISMNSAFETLTGFALNDYLGKSFESLVYKDDLDLANETFHKALNGEILQPYILRLNKKNGDYFYGEFTSKGLVENDVIIGEFGIIRDITSNKNAEDALRASEERYRVFINSTSDMAFLKDDKFRYMIVNKSYADFFNKPEHYILGKNDFELMPVEGAESCYKTDIDAMNSNTVIINEENVFGRIYETHKFQVDLGDGSIGIGGYIRDITERINAVEALKQSKNQYSTLIDTMNDGLIQVDNDDVILFVNKAICDIFGYEEEELIGKIGNETIIFPDDKYIVIENNRKRLEHISERYEVRGVKKSGDIIWLRISGSPVLDSKGNTTGSVGLFSDITVRKNAEIQLISEKRFSDFLIESLPGLFYMFDTNLKPIRWNNNKLNFLGLTPEEMENHNILKSIVEVDKEKFVHSTEKTMTTGEDQDIIKLIRFDGEVFSYHLTGKRLDTDSGAYMMGVGIDVTDRVRIEQELVVAKEKAEESERIKTSFLANMSHELRTPMVGILGFSQLLSETEDLEKAKEMGEIINSSGKRLMDTLNMILDLARIEAGESEVEISELDLVSNINDVIIVFDAIAKTKNLILKFLSEFDYYITYTSSKIIIGILNNLINNAIKFTNTGSIIITLENEVIDKLNYAIIKVSDTGIGISDNNLSHIFDEFRQVSEGLDRSHEGTGLGLTLCKKYVEMLSGSISVASSLGVGTEFTIRIPDLNITELDENTNFVKNDSTTNKVIFEMQKSLNLRILVVDDDPTSLYLVERILSNQFFIDTVSNSNDAIEKAKENHYALIFMDINLGKSKNGLYATAEIRKLENYRTTPIIAMTAYAMAGDREEFISKGCTGYISKPFEKNQLIETVLEFI